MNFSSFLRFGLGKCCALALMVSGFAGTGHANLVVNGGFEDASAGTWTMSTTAAPGWTTTAPDHMMEIWSNGMMGEASYEGNQFMELNANQMSTLYQDISGISAGSLLNFAFAHQGRETLESMIFSITDLGTDGIYGTADDSSLFSKIYTDGITGWSYYTSATESSIFATGDKIRIAFESLVPGSRGNFLDGVEVGATSDVAMTPEPSVWAAMVLLLLSSCGSSLYRRMRPAHS